MDIQTATEQLRGKVGDVFTVTDPNLQLSQLEQVQRDVAALLEHGFNPPGASETLPAAIAFDRLVDLAKLRWRIERDYQELKQEVGLGHFEGRGWRGFHHHATLCIAAYGFLISERETIPPCGPRAARFIPAAVLSDGYRPRGSAAAARASHPQLNRNHAPPPDCRLGQDSAAMPLLLSTNGKTLATEDFMMQ